MKYIDGRNKDLLLLTHPLYLQSEFTPQALIEAVLTKRGSGLGGRAGRLYFCQPCLRRSHSRKKSLITDVHQARATGLHGIDADNAPVPRAFSLAD